MKPTNNNRLIYRLITNKLIQDLFNYLLYLYLIFQFYQFYYLAYINIDRFVKCSI